MGKEVPKIYPPKKWKCPGCGKDHKAPHYAHPGQINYDLKPGVVGRVDFNRRSKDDTLDYSREVNPNLPREANRLDSGGYQRPIFCPHCGWEDEWFIFTKKSMEKMIDSMGNTALVEEFLSVMNGTIENLPADQVLFQFIGYLKGKGVI